MSHHDAFTIERSYAASPAKVFDAWSTPGAKARWFSGPSEWTRAPHQLDVPDRDQWCRSPSSSRELPDQRHLQPGR
jgi:uncharacterized protein YndB with AHSA1/START domain